LQLLAAATAINLQRLLATQDGASGEQAGDPGGRAAQIIWLIDLLAHALTEISRLTATDSSTGS
ncbi:MAG: hypothetical protein ACR2F4_03720, partial [Thermoleophilaceae bacterium]